MSKQPQADQAREAREALEAERAAPGGQEEWQIEDQGAPVYLDGVQAQWRIRDADDNTVAYVFKKTHAERIASMQAETQAPAEAQTAEAMETALQRYIANTTGDDKFEPLEQLRFFCSLAMNGQDWLDSEPFFDALATQSPSAPPPTYITSGSRCDKCGQSLIDHRDQRYCPSAPPAAPAIDALDEGCIRKALAVACAKSNVPNAFRLAIFDHFIPRWQALATPPAGQAPKEPT